MRTSPFGKLLMVSCISFAFAGILFMNLSWVVIALALACMFVNSRVRFGWEIGRMRLKVTHAILDKMVFANEPASIRVDILNKGSVAIKGIFEDVIKPEAEIAAGDRRVELTIPPSTIASFNYSFVPKQRGKHEITGTKLELKDKFRLLSEDVAIPSMLIVTAHTRRESFDVARKIAGKEHFEFSGASRAPARVLREFEFDGIREYVAGDRGRDIHWKAFSKTGELMTKTYKKEGALQTMIFVDCGRSMRLIDAEGKPMIDHAVDLTMQMSKVLLSSYHQVGVALFDEVSVLQECAPTLARHHFDEIVKVLKEAPGSLTRIEAASGNQPSKLAATPSVVPVTSNLTKEGGDFLSAVQQLRADGKGRGIGLERAMRGIMARRKGQELLFIIVSDLGSSRDAVLTAAKLAEKTGDQMLVIHTYDDWYSALRKSVDVAETERLYGNIAECLKVEGRLRGLGSSYLRIGPADTAAYIIRSVRRGLA